MKPIFITQTPDSEVTLIDLSEFVEVESKNWKLFNVQVVLKLEKKINIFVAMFL